jgi:hypothetical protein
MDLLQIYPELKFKPVFKEGALLLLDGDEEFELSFPSSTTIDMPKLLHQLDGKRSAAAIRSELPAEHGDSFDQLLKELARHGLFEDRAPLRVRTALEALFEIEDLTNELLYRTIYQNVFWRRLAAPTLDFPVSVLHGLAIENYHFLFRESFFDSPVLGNQQSAPVRRLMNEFYVDEYGHDELILKGLNSLGISREDLEDTMPLPETMALCNALCFWAASDPLFFFSTLGLLEGKDLKKDSYIEACERFGLPEAFVGPIRSHAMINLKGEHGNLTRCIFKDLPPVDDESMARLRRQTHLFVDIYDQFFTGVWNHYSSCDGRLLRRVSEI